MSWWHNREFRPQDNGYTDDLVTQHAIDFIRESKDRPFFCYVPFHIAHAPLQAKESDLATVDPQLAATLPSAKAKTTAEDKHTHAAMLHALDNNVAAILAELDKLALRDNKPSPVESYYWTWRNEDAIRTADWKLHRFFDHNELYAIKADESEAHNVAEAQPDIVKALIIKMDNWADSLGAALTHQAAPKKYIVAPAPEGEVLAISVTITDKAQPKDRLIVPFIIGATHNTPPTGSSLTSPSLRTHPNATHSTHLSKAMIRRPMCCTSSEVKGSTNMPGSRSMDRG